jgi:hypothetical protein
LQHDITMRYLGNGFQDCFWLLQCRFMKCMTWEWDYLTAVTSAWVSTFFFLRPIPRIKLLHHVKECCTVNDSLYNSVELSTAREATSCAATR